MNTTAALTPTQPRKINLQPLLSSFGKIGRAVKRALDGAARGAAAGGVAGAMLGMIFFAWSLNTPFGKLFDEVVSASIILVVISTLGGLSALAFALLRAGLRRVYAHPQRPLRWIAALPYFITWLVPLPLVFGGAGIFLASQLYAWFPQAVVYFLTRQGPVIPIVVIEAALGTLTGIFLALRPQRRFMRILAFSPAAVNLLLAAFLSGPASMITW